MANKRIGYDGGACIIVGGVPYSKVTSPVQPTSGAINASPTTINISAYTWIYDDNNVNGGSSHNPWTACEMGISNYVPANVSSVTLVTAGVYYTLYTAPSAGIIKTYINSNSSGNCWKVNGVVAYCYNPYVGDLGRFYSTSLALGLALGDVVTCCGGTNGLSAYGYFLPNVYP